MKVSSIRSAKVGGYPALLWRPLIVQLGRPFEGLNTADRSWFVAGKEMTVAAKRGEPLVLLRIRKMKALPGGARRSTWSPPSFGLRRPDTSNPCNSRPSHNGTSACWGEPFLVARSAARWRAKLFSPSAPAPPRSPELLVGDPDACSLSPRSQTRWFRRTVASPQIAGRC